MPRLFGITLRLLMPIRWNATSLQFYASVAFFLIFLIIIRTYVTELLKVHTLQVRRYHLDNNFIIHAS